ncbi:hypothetical protein MMC15_007957 [Xylographa vitiligo]|nr:hypothetical protein [Xylographa vitiligo]
MAADYTKHKNAELEQLLRARSLPHTGKKADLIARLVQDDGEKKAARPPPTASSAPEDEIDWDDDPAAATKAPTTATIETPTLARLPPGAGAGRAANPLAVPNQLPAIDPSATHDLTVMQPTTTDPDSPASVAANNNSNNYHRRPSAATPPSTYTPPAASTLPPVSVEAELTKRLARAQKFNLSAEAVFEAEKALERFRKFGTVVGGGQRGGGLEGALPERGKGKRGRGEDGEGEGKGKGAKRVDSRRRGGSREPGGGKEGVGERDRRAAEARKARFGGAL